MPGTAALMTETQVQAAAGLGSVADPAIELHGVVKEFHSGDETVTAVAGIDLVIAQGEFFSMLGPSGCGKTTTMRVIAGFEEPTAGVVRLEGRDVTAQPQNKRNQEMVLEFYALFPEVCVAENGGFGLRRRKVLRAKIYWRVS